MALGIALIGIATLLALVVAYLVVYEVAADAPQYLTFFWVKEVRGWIAAATLGLVAATFAAIGIRLYAASGTARARASA